MKIGAITQTEVMVLMQKLFAEASRAVLCRKSDWMIGVPPGPQVYESFSCIVPDCPFLHDMFGSRFSVAFGQTALGMHFQGEIKKF